MSKHMFKTDKNSYQSRQYVPTAILSESSIIYYFFTFFIIQKFWVWDSLYTLRLNIQFVNYLPGAASHVMGPHKAPQMRPS